jgi:hypothetical protein
MVRSTALVSLVLLAAGALGCPSLAALECQGSGCADAASDGRPVGVDASARDAGADAAAETSEAGAQGIRCADGGVFCEPTSQECCVRQGSSCVARVANSCSMGTDIFCDDPSQCAGDPCWICLGKSGDLLGASCAHADLVNWGCGKTGALPLCRASGECEAGTTCEPLAVVGFASSPDASWFSACQ